MKLNEIFFARLILSSQEEYDFFLKKYSGTGIIIELFYNKKINHSDVPGILINNLYAPNLNLDELNIPFVVNTPPKNIDETEKRVSYYVDKLSYLYHPYEEQNYDAILDGEFNDFLLKEIDVEKLIFLYFDRKCLYLYCSGKLIAINLESLFYVYNNFKSFVDALILKYNCCIFSFKNFQKYVSDTNYQELKTFENIIWTKEQYEISEKTVFNYFGGVYIPKNIPYIMDVYVRQNNIDEQEWVSIRKFYKKDYITDWLSNQEIFFKNKITNLDLIEKTNLFYCKIKYSNKRAITNRIYNHDDNFNIQTLPKQSEIRSQIVSRYKKGKLVVFDYVSFETRIAIYATSDLDFIERFKNQDLHDYTSKIIFNKQEISKEERQTGKLFNHALLYGGGEDRLKSIIKNDIGENSYEIIYKKIIEDLNPIIELSEYINNQNKEIGYVINPYGTVIRPRKNYASFNNFIQSTASEIVVEKLFEIKNFIQNKKIHFIYQVFDSFVFDFNESEFNNINELRDLLVHNKKMDFPVEHKMGTTLADCGIEELVEFDI